MKKNTKKRNTKKTNVKPRTKNKEIIKFEPHRPLGVDKKYDMGNYYLSKL